MSRFSVDASSEGGMLRIYHVSDCFSGRCESLPLHGSVTGTQERVISICTVWRLLLWEVDGRVTRDLCFAFHGNHVSGDFGCGTYRCKRMWRYDLFSHLPPSWRGWVSNVFQINEDGAVARDGRLRIGQRILEVHHCVKWDLSDGRGRRERPPVRLIVWPWPLCNVCGSMMVFVVMGSVAGEMPLMLPT